MYNLLTDEFKDQQQELVKIILEVASVGSIYLLGSTLMTRRTESIFMPDAPSCRYVGHYHLLILIDGTRSTNQVQDQIENTCRNFIPVTAIVLHSGQFRDWLASGHYFAVNACQKAVILHGEILEVSALTIEEANQRFEYEKQSVLSKGITMVNEFIAGAELFQLRKQNHMAAFMLHQAAEHGLQTILKVSSGLYINTHNLDKLIRYCSMASYKILDLFPRNNEKDERLFQLLQKAYIETRYKTGYTIYNIDLLVLKKRIEELQRSI